MAERRKQLNTTLMVLQPWVSVVFGHQSKEAYTSHTCFFISFFFSTLTASAQAAKGYERGICCSYIPKYLPILVELFCSALNQQLLHARWPDGKNLAEEELEGDNGYSPELTLLTLS